MVVKDERLLSLVSVLIDLLLDATDDAAMVESSVRSVGFSDDELRDFGFDVERV